MPTRFSLVLWLKLMLHGVSFTLLLLNYYWAITDQLGGDPVKAIIHFTGLTALQLLLLSLVISPLTRYVKKSELITLRRPLGLWCFVYSVCHLANFIAFDLVFDWSLFFSEVVKRPYITLGMLAWVLLLLLAITSVPLIKRQLGKRWQQLHNSVYVVVLLVVIHFYWSVKSDIVEPVFYLVVTVILLALRQRKIRRIFGY
jgi:sulfoxide reductase heme-binding subunit YedZ